MLRVIFVLSLFVVCFSRDYEGCPFSMSLYSAAAAVLEPPFQILFFLFFSRRALNVGETGCRSAPRKSQSFKKSCAVFLVDRL